MNALSAVALMSPYKGAITPLYAATAASMEEGGGSYFVPYAKRATPNKLAQNVQLAEELWNFSMEVVNEKLGTVE